MAHTSVYNMSEDCYNTKILPAAVHLKTADKSSMLLSHLLLSVQSKVFWTEMSLVLDSTY